MATEYGFELGGPATASEVANLFTSAATAHGLADEDAVRFDGPGSDLRSGVLVAVTAPSPLPFPDPVETRFGFTPVVDVLFRFDSFTDTQVQKQDMIRLVVTALAAFTGDALLTFADEIVWLLRQSGRLTISKHNDFWTPDLVALLPPHDRVRLPNM